MERVARSWLACLRESGLLDCGWRVLERAGGGGEIRALVGVGPAKQTPLVLNLDSTLLSLLSLCLQVIRVRSDVPARFVGGVAPFAGGRSGGGDCNHVPAAVASRGRPGVQLGGSRGAVGSAEVESGGPR